MYKNFIAIIGLALMLTGCANMQNVKPVTDLVLLQYEYETVRDQFRDTDLTPGERLEFESAINLFEEVRTELHNLSNGDINASFLLEAAMADSILDKAAEAFLEAEGVVVSYYIRTGEPIPARFIAYKSSAVDTYNVIKDLTDTNELIPWESVKSFVSLALRSYLTITTGV